MNIYEVIVRPLETEKAYAQRELGQYAFMVNRKANKGQIRRAVEEIYDFGRGRAIGVSNFLVHHLESLLAEARIKPMVDQVEFHPYLQQPDLQAFCRKHQIQLEAWRPIMKGKVNQVPELVQLGQTYGKTPVQVTLRWMIQRGVVAIPKSEQQARIQSNADIFDFDLTAEDLAMVDSLNRHERLGVDPDNFDFDF